MKNQLFNIGAHALYKKGAGKSILDELGIVLKGKSPMLSGVLLENKQMYTAPFNPFAVATTSYLKWIEKFEWIKLLVKLMRIQPQTIEEQTFHQWATNNSKSDKVKQLLFILGRLSSYCHAPESTSASVILSHIKNGVGGVIYLDDGWKTIMEQLHNQAVLFGAEVKLRSHVTQVTNDAEHLRVLLDNGSEFVGKKIIYTGVPTELPNLLNKETLGSHHTYDHCVPVKAAALDIALSELPNPKIPFAMGISEPLYYSVHSKYAKLSKDGKGHIIHILKYYNPNDIIDRSKVKGELEDFLTMIQPGWKKYEITSRYLTNITVSNRLPILESEKSLPTSNLEQQGIYVAGDWASKQYILSEAAISSGKDVAYKIVGKN